MTELSWYLIQQQDPGTICDLFPPQDWDGMVIAVSNSTNFEKLKFIDV